MTDFRIPSAATALFFMIAFIAISLIWFVGPKKRRTSSIWFGLTFVSLAAYAPLAHFAEPLWCPMAAAGVAVVTFATGLVVARIRVDR